MSSNIAARLRVPRLGTGNREYNEVLHARQTVIGIETMRTTSNLKHVERC